MKNAMIYAIRVGLAVVAGLMLGFGISIGIASQL
jgi:hypothetical protein